MKRVIYYTNAILGTITILGFITIYLGLMGMMVVGGLHILSLLYYFMVWKTLSARSKKGIMYYCSVLAFILGLTYVGYTSESDELFVPIMILSGLAGVFFTILIAWIHNDAKALPAEETLEGILDSGLH